MRRLVPLVIAMGAAVALSVAPVRAGLGLDVSPAKLDIAIPSGQTYNMPILVRNDQAASVHVQASETDFTVDEKGEYHFSSPGSSSHSLMKWATINPREFDLPANSSQQVRVTFAIPKDATLTGEYAGIVFFQTRPERKRGAVSISARVASKIYQTFPGTTKVTGAIEKMSVAAGSANELYRIAFKNTGNTHVYLKGNVEIRKDGHVVQKLPIDGNPLVERGGMRLLELQGRRLDPGAYDVVAVLDYGGSALTGGQVRFEAR